MKKKIFKVAKHYIFNSIILLCIILLLKLALTLKYTQKLVLLKIIKKSKNLEEISETNLASLIYFFCFKLYNECHFV